MNHQMAQQMENRKQPQTTIIPDWFAQKIGETEIRHWNETQILREHIKGAQAKIAELEGINATVGKQLAEKMAELQKYIDTFGDIETAQAADSLPASL